jgi:hypothetical protein
MWYVNAITNNTVLSFFFLIQGCIKMIETVLAPIYIYFYAGEEPITSTYIGGSILILTIIGHSIAAFRDNNNNKPKEKIQGEDDGIKANTLPIGVDEHINIEAT